ncbi:MAG: glycosyltransferase [Candidatus Omnitrophota bacterium]
MRVVLAHDWLNGMRGGEKCLEVLCELYPPSPLLALFYQPDKVSRSIVSHPLTLSWLQRMPGITKHYRHYLPLYPAAVSSLRVPECDVVVSTSHCVAKGVRKPTGAKHFCYCFTPMRYAWGFFDEYFGGRSAVERAIIRRIIDRIRTWDLSASQGVDVFAAISEHVRQRIRRCYNRDATVIYPPVDTDFYTPDFRTTRSDYYLVVSALVPYKRVDLAIEAFNKNGRPLWVVGEGPERAKLEKMAGANVRFLGWKSDDELRTYYRRARALLFPGEEDFGIVPLEMNACGGPVIAYGAGGALETIQDGKSGIFFAKQTVEDLLAAVETFEGQRFYAELIRQSAIRFSRQRFRLEIDKAIRGVI